MNYVSKKNGNDIWLEHHGILGMKWGKRNGPPYPLSPSKHSASEKKAGWRKSLDSGGKGGSSSSSKKSNKASASKSKKVAGASTHSVSSKKTSNLAIGEAKTYTDEGDMITLDKKGRYRPVHYKEESTSRHIIGKAQKGSSSKLKERLDKTDTDYIDIKLAEELASTLDPFFTDLKNGKENKAFQTLEKTLKDFDFDLDINEIKSNYEEEISSGMLFSLRLKGNKNEFSVGGNVVDGRVDYIDDEVFYPRKK